MDPQQEANREHDKMSSTSPTSTTAASASSSEEGPPPMKRARPSMKTGLQHAEGSEFVRSVLPNIADIEDRLSRLSSPISDVELLRLQALHSSDLLDPQSHAHIKLERYTTLIASIFQCPVAFVNFITADTQNFTARIGLDVNTAKRDEGLCPYTILPESAEVLVVHDLLEDDRVKNLSLVTELGVRFYCGAAIYLSGYKIGTVCAMDMKPRQFTLKDQQTMLGIAAAISDLVQERQKNAMHSKDRTAQRLERKIQGLRGPLQTVIAAASASVSADAQEPGSETALQQAMGGISELYAVIEMSSLLCRVMVQKLKLSGVPYSILPSIAKIKQAFGREGNAGVRFKVATGLEHLPSLLSYPDIIHYILYSVVNAEKEKWKDITVYISVSYEGFPDLTNGRVGDCALFQLYSNHTRFYLNVRVSTRQPGSSDDVALTSGFERADLEDFQTILEMTREIGGKIYHVVDPRALSEEQMYSFPVVAEKGSARFAALDAEEFEDDEESAKGESSGSTRGSSSSAYSSANVSFCRNGSSSADSSSIFGGDGLTAASFSPSSSSSSIRVLLIEPPSSLQRAVVRHLRTRGCQVDVVDSGRAGLALLQAHRYQICFVEYLLQVMLGTELLAAIKSDMKDKPDHHCAGTMFVGISASVDAHLLAEAALLDMAQHAFLPKPIATVLLDRILQAVSGAVGDLQAAVAALAASDSAGSYDSASATMSFGSSTSGSGSREGQGSAGSFGDGSVGGRSSSGGSSGGVGDEDTMQYIDLDDANEGGR